MREPVVSGVAGGVGTRSVAIALGVGAYAPGTHQPCDLLVCRATVYSVTLAERHIAAAGGSPVLAVVVEVEGVPRAVRAKLTMLAPHTEGMVKVPWVSRWREVSNPYAEASQLAFRPADTVPKHLRDYHAAMVSLVHLVRPLVAVAQPTGLRPPPAPPPPEPRQASPGGQPFALPFHSITTAGGH
jgi:hypothetical protein